jgi:hypothetical protein
MYTYKENHMLNWLLRVFGFLPAKKEHISEPQQSVTIAEPVVLPVENVLPVEEVTKETKTPVKKARKPRAKKKTNK